jgi:hypothetical protein
MLAERRAKNDSKEAQPPDGKADGVREPVPGFLDKRHPNSTDGLGNNGGRNEPEGDYPVPNWRNAHNGAKWLTYNMKNQAKRVCTIHRCRVALRRVALIHQPRMRRAVAPRMNGRNWAF